MRWRQSSRRGDSDRGAATVLAAFLVVLVLTIGLGAMGVSAAVIARHRAQSAADLAALGAAARLPAGVAAACGCARDIAMAMRADLVGCEVVDLDVTVHVQVPAMVGVARASARAGPVVAAPG